VEEMLIFPDKGSVLRHMWDGQSRLREVLFGRVKILCAESKFSGRFSQKFAVSFSRLKNKCAWENPAGRKEVLQLMGSQELTG